MACLGSCPRVLGRVVLDFQELPELLEAPHLPQLCPGATTPPTPSEAPTWQRCCMNSALSTRVHKVEFPKPVLKQDREHEGAPLIQ